jgi:hypothetical protein
MLTNIVAYLHTTLAYQSAAMQLMVGQANFDAQQLHLPESLPIVVPANTNDWHLAMPPDGVTGTLATSNYLYRFNSGKLTSIQVKKQPHSAAQAQLSLIDTNGAYQLARQWLAALSVDVATLERECPHTVQMAVAVSAAPSEPNREHHHLGESPHRLPGSNHVTYAAAPRTALPLFRVDWGGGRSQPTAPGRAPVEASVQILGSTKQCLSLRIFNADLLRAPPLQVTNAAALLGPPPPPQKFVEDLLGGQTAYDTVARPDRVLIWLLSKPADGSEGQISRSQAFAVNAATAAMISRALTNFNSYSWLDQKACTPDYGVALSFIRGTDTVDVLWCSECDHLQVTHNNWSAEKDCDAARSALVAAAKAVFPGDEIIKKLTFSNPNQSP